jgi:hypothetical protein
MGRYIPEDLTEEDKAIAEELKKRFISTSELAQMYNVDSMKIRLKIMKLDYFYLLCEEERRKEIFYKIITDKDY